MNDTITAKELIDLIISTKPTAEVENDEGLYAKPSAEIEVDDDGMCSLAVHAEIGDSLDMGNFLIEIGGVDITVGREVDGPNGDYEFDGKNIAYEDGLTQADVIAVIKENVEFPPYNEMQYSETDFDPDDVEESIEVDEGDVFAEDDDGNIYCYSDADEVPDDQTVIESSDAIHRLVEEWSENGGEADGDFIESFGPWG